MQVASCGSVPVAQLESWITMMNAVQFTEYGGPDVLRVLQVDEPHAAAREVRIAVRAAGVNQIDWKIRAGHMSDMMPMSLPAGRGLDAAGVVDEIGDEVRAIAVGEFGRGSATGTSRLARAAGEAFGVL
jgi:NADPH:quinone reductase-like Zn-dependent oxidoreductase